MDKIKKIIDKCEIELNGNVFTKEMIMQSYEEFMYSTLKKEGHNVALILHTGSQCFNVFLLVYIAISNFVFNETNSEDIVKNLRVGDIVIYGRGKQEKYRFQKITDEKGEIYAVLQKKDGGMQYVPQKRWNAITPYYGETEKLGGTGLKRYSKEKKLFLNEIMEITGDKQVNAVDTSSVVVMSRNLADELLKNIKIRFKGNVLDFLDLVTASYFTEKMKEYPYRGNSAKTDPILKITGKISVARKLLYRRTENKNIGLAVLGEDIITRGYLELPELIQRQSIKYIYFSTTIDTANGVKLLKEYDNIKTFACTKDFLLSYSKDIVCENELTKELYEQINTVIDQEIGVHVLESDMLWGDYNFFISALKDIKYSNYNLEEKDMFIRYAYSLKNLFLTSPFTMSELEECIEKGELESTIEKPSEKIAKIKEYYENFPENIREKAQIVINFLEEYYKSLLNNSPKRNYVKEYLKDNRNSKIAVVVPKAYYAKVMKSCGINPWRKNYMSDIQVYTANQFDNSKIYDSILVLGDIEGKRFNCFRCKASQNIISILYKEIEEKTYVSKRKNASDIDSIYNTRSELSIEEDSQFEIIDDKEIEEDEIKDIITTEKDIKKQIEEADELLDIQLVKQMYKQNHQKIFAHVTYAVTFESEEKAYFTEYYKAYVFNQEQQEIREIKAEELSEGDEIVFTRNDDETKDIVDSILHDFVEQKKYKADISKKYEMSKRWKKVLREYMNKERLTENEVWIRMKEKGIGVTEQTIRNWLDEDSHTVGPRDKESVRKIAILTEDYEMLDNVDLYYDAIRIIRKARYRILTEIGKVIRNKLSGKNISTDSISNFVYEKVDSSAKILRIERISEIDEEVPFYLTNKPLHIKER